MGKWQSGQLRQIADLQEKSFTGLNPVLPFPERDIKANLLRTVRNVS